MHRPACVRARLAQRGFRHVLRLPGGAINDDAYRIVLILHILCAIVGFGAVFLNGIYAAQAKSRKGPEGLAIAEANFKVSKVGELFIYAVFLLGFALVAMSDDLLQVQPDLAVARGGPVRHRARHLARPLIPREKKLLALMRELVAAGPPGAGTGGPPPQVAQMEALGKQCAAFGGTLNVLLIVIVFLMVWKPGGPRV